MKMKNAVLRRWLAKDAQQRTANDAEKFACETWDEGLRLAKSPDNHYQHVMNTVRFRINESKRYEPAVTRGRDK